MEETVENIEETTGNTVAKRQLKEQLGSKEEIFFFAFLKSTPKFSTLNFLSTLLSAKLKKRKEKAKQKKKKKTANFWYQKSKKKPASAKLKYNCGCFNNIKKQ